MINILRSTCSACLLIALSGCFIEINEQRTSEADALDDAIEQDASTAVFSDGLIPPTAPELSISATIGALQFNWTNEDDSGEPVISTSLYQYDARTDIETLIDNTLELENANVELAVSPHQLAWDSTSFRIETCTSTNCLSSLHMPIHSFLADALEVVQPSSANLYPTYGSHLALNATGNVALVANPRDNNATVLIRPANEWVLAGTLTPAQIGLSDDAELRVAVSSTGDTMVIAYVNVDSNPNVAIFERLGENWIETETFEVFGGNQLSDITRTWNTGSLHLTLSGNGDRLAIGAQQLNVSSRASDREDNNRVVIFERNSLSWSETASLSVPNRHFRLRAFSSSVELDTLMTLSTSNGALYLNEFRLNNNSWQTTDAQRLNNVMPTGDALIVSSSDGRGAAVASWEFDSNGNHAPVAWKLERQAGGWIATDSVRQSVVATSSAQLRLATNADVSSVAVGWQATTSAGLVFYKDTDDRLQPLFNFPRALSVAFSRDNSTALVGAAGGFFSFASAD